MPFRKRKRAAAASGAAAGGARKRGAGAAGAAHGGAGGAVAKAAEAARGDAHVDSDEEPSSAEERGPRAAAESDAEDAFFETPDEKRVRLAKEYLARLGDGGAVGPGQVQEQLALDAEQQARRLRLQVEDLALGQARFLKGHQRAATCVCLTGDERTCFTGGKDCALLRWDVETGKKDVFPGRRNDFDSGFHFERVLGVCLVEPRQVFASVGVDRVLRLWDPRVPSRTRCAAALLGHQGAVTAVAAEADGNQLYTVGADKALKVWDVRAKRCTDTLFGHVAGVTCMDLYNKGRPLTGGADKTARLWKVDKDTHLMFSRHTYAVDAVTVVDQDRFVSGSQDGKIFVWSHASKKPIATTSLGSNCWITAVQAVRRSSVFFSGSVDGLLRSWRFTREGDGDDKALQLTPAAESLQAPGCINAIAVGRRVLACAVGTEHKHGRWFYNKKQRNGLLLVPLSYREG